METFHLTYPSAIGSHPPPYLRLRDLWAFGRPAGVMAVLTLPGWFDDSEREDKEQIQDEMEDSPKHGFEGSFL